MPIDPFGLEASVDSLWRALGQNSAEHARNLAQLPDKKDVCDLIAALSALVAVIEFLEFSPSGSTSMDDRYKGMKILVYLRQALLGLLEGGAPAPFLRAQPKSPGRRADVSSILTLKGILAGFMHCQQRAGMSRHQAAKWVADNMSPKLATLISRKPVTPRMVEEWFDRYGGKHAEQNSARKAYLTWSRGSPITKKKFTTITERIAAGWP
jgi:hypothetical protein